MCGVRIGQASHIVGFERSALGLTHGYVVGGKDVEGWTSHRIGEVPDAMVAPGETVGTVYQFGSINGEPQFRAGNREREVVDGGHVETRFSTAIT